MAVNNRNDMKEKVQESIINEGIVQNKLSADTPAMAALDESNLDRVAGGFVTEATADGRYVNLLDGVEKHATKEGAKQTIAMMAESGDYWSFDSGFQDLKAVQLDDGMYGITYNNNCIYDNKQDAIAGARTIENRTGKH